MDSRLKPTTHTTTDEKLKRYLNASERFLSDNANHISKLVLEGQDPKTLLICCVDSRVPPTNLLELPLGEAFIMRTVANLVPVFNPTKTPNATAATLEFAITRMNVKDIIIMGHSHCGGIQALLNGEKDPSPLQKNSFINSWVNIASPAKARVLSNLPGASADDMGRACEQEAIVNSVQNLLTYPWIKEKVDQGRLSLHGWWCDLDTRKIHVFNPDSRKFEASDAIPATPSVMSLPRARL